MGLEDFVQKEKVYLVESKLLGKKWIVQAKSQQDVAGKILSKYKKELYDLERASETGDINLDITIKEIEEKITEF